MGKSKKRVRYDSGRESDQLRTQAGIDANNVGAAIEAAIEQSNAEIVSEITASTEGAVEQTVPTTTETGTAEQAIPTTTTPEEPSKEPQTNGTCKPEIHWSANPSVEFRNANTEFLALLSEVGTPDEDIKATAEYILSQGSEEDALKIILTTIEQHKSLINQTKPNKGEETMADNNTNPNTTTPVDNNATAMAAAMQQQAAVAAVPPAAAAGMSTTEKVVLYTAAGVAVVGLIVGVIALAKAAKANNTIASMGDAGVL